MGLLNVKAIPPGPLPEAWGLSLHPGGGRGPLEMSSLEKGALVSVRSHSCIQTTPRPITMTFQITVAQEKILPASRERKQVTFKDRGMSLCSYRDPGS